MYLDDGVLTNVSPTELNVQVSWVRKYLKACGILVSEEKSLWKPFKHLEWLGIIIDLELISFVASARKVSALHDHP